MASPPSPSLSCGGRVECIGSRWMSTHHSAEELDDTLLWYSQKLVCSCFTFILIITFSGFIVTTMRLQHTLLLSRRQKALCVNKIEFTSCDFLFMCHFTLLNLFALTETFLFLIPSFLSSIDSSHSLGNSSHLLIIVTWRFLLSRLINSECTHQCTVTLSLRVPLDTLTGTLFDRERRVHSPSLSVKLWNIVATNTRYLVRERKVKKTRMYLLELINASCHSNVSLRENISSFIVKTSSFIAR